MDYTLIHYKVDEWEQRAYAHLKQKSTKLKWPIKGLTYKRDFAVRGLIIDTELGNIVKADRSGYIKQLVMGQHLKLRQTEDNLRKNISRPLRLKMVFS
jgi:hypothetical protein